MLIDLILCRSYSSNHNFYASLNESVLPCPKDTISLEFFLLSGSYYLSTPFCMLFPKPWKSANFEFSHIFSFSCSRISFNSFIYLLILILSEHLRYKWFNVNIYCLILYVIYTYLCVYICTNMYTCNMHIIIVIYVCRIIYTYIHMIYICASNTWFCFS